MKLLVNDVKSALDLANASLADCSFKRELDPILVLVVKQFFKDYG